MTGSPTNKIPNRFLSKTIFLYIVKETFFAFSVCFLFFFFIFFVNQLLLMAGQILSKRVPVFQVALLVFYAIPSIIALAAPFASLSGTLMTIGRLSTDNEILVLLSSGISYANIIGPALFVGIVISVLSFCANDILLPAGTIQFSRLYRRVAVSSPGLEFESNSVKRFKNTVIINGQVSGRAINDIIILDRTGEGERRVIVSKEASLRESEKNRISIDLKDAFVQMGKETDRRNYDYASSGGLTYTMSQEDAVQAVYDPGPREMSSVDVRVEIKKKEEALHAGINREKRNLAGRALLLEDALRAGPGSSGWRRIEDLEDEYLANLSTVSAMKRDRILSIYRLEFYKKFSIPFGALCFVFLAVTLGLLAKKSGQTVGFLIGVIISVLYWALLLGGQTAGTQLGFSPFWSMWLPNILSLGAGLILVLYRLRR
ncbi:MAG: LptF/LptG family permease [Treponema sp.]|jgi:lipopolysaccharide export system permease protein|nr:LptF/LptG family permease [Treponema sp.]